MMKILVGLALMVLAYTISWGICIGLIYLISLCFSLKFNLMIATGVWLCLCLLKAVFSPSNRRKE